MSHNGLTSSHTHHHTTVTNRPAPPIETAGEGVSRRRSKRRSVVTRTATRGVLYVHSAPSALCPHIEWATGGVLGVAPQMEWTPQPAQSGSYRTEYSWSADPGTAAALTSALRGWNHLRFEVTEEAHLGHRGSPLLAHPDLGVFHAVTGLHGDIMIPEDRLKAAVVKAVARRDDAGDRDRQAPRQALGRRAGDLPARRRRRRRALAAPGRLAPVREPANAQVAGRG